MRWINDAFDDHIVQFPGKGSWQIIKKLAEKERLAWNMERDNEWYPSEAHGVYECIQVEGAEIGTHAILKIRVQSVAFARKAKNFPAYYPSRIPEKNPPRPSDKGTKYAEFHYSTENEIRFLERLTTANCPASPRLLAVSKDVQKTPILRRYNDEEDQPYWVPGGYIVYILMEKLPGKDLEDFFWPNRYSLQEREEVRQAFREAFLFVHTNRRHVLKTDIFTAWSISAESLQKTVN